MAEAGMGRRFGLASVHAEVAHDVADGKFPAGRHKIPDEMTHHVAEYCRSGKARKAEQGSCCAEQMKT